MLEALEQGSNLPYDVTGFNLNVELRESYPW